MSGRQGRDYLFLSLSQPGITDSGHPVLDKIGLSASCLANLDDASLSPWGISPSPSSRTRRST
jgi:hypothetical protein